MQGSDFIFCLQDAQYRFWQIDASGMVIKSNQPYFLEFSPDGWSDIAIQNIRNKKYWGIDRSVTVPLSYVEDGATILKDIFYRLGIEESVYLVIAKQELEYNPGVDYGYWYKQMYRGEVDLSTYNHSGSKVTCTTLEDGLPKYLKANEATTFEIAMDVPEAINVAMDGINLHEKLNFSDVSGLGVSIAVNGTNFLGPISYIGHDGNNTGFAIDSENIENVNGIPFEEKVKKQNTLLVNVDQPTTVVTIAGTIEYVCTSMTSSPAFATRFRFLRSNQLIGDQNDYEIISTPAMVVGQTYTQDFSVDVPLQKGESLLREGIFFGGPGSDATIEFTENSKFTITFLTRHAETYIKAHRPQFLFNKLIDLLTESNYSAETSTYFETYKQVVFTCGNALRGFEDAVMKISWNDFFQFWDSFDSVGISQKGSKVNFDSKVALVDTLNVIDLPEPSNFRVSVAKEYLFNELQIGYPELKNEVGVLNGNEEFNTKYLFSLGSTKNPAKIDKVSRVKASCYEIELVRITTVSKETTDYKADSDLFVLHVEADLQPAAGDIPEHYRLDRSLNASATGLIEPDTVFNIFLSPKRNLYRNGPFLRSSMYLADNLVLQYKSVDKNNKLVADGIVEKADVPMSTLSDKFFLPVVFDFDVPAPNDLINLLDLDPTTLFRFPFYGVYYTGIMGKTSIAPSSRKEQNYQLLSTADNNLLDLINFYG